MCMGCIICRGKVMTCGDYAYILQGSRSGTGSSELRDLCCSFLLKETSGTLFFM